MEVCEDPDCPGYYKPLVDRGWGYPVCQNSPWFSAYYPGSENKPLAERYRDEVYHEHKTT